MLLANDEKLKLHFLNAKINLKRYLKLSGEINRNLHNKNVIGIEMLNHQTEAFKAYQAALGEYSRLLQERKINELSKVPAKVKPNPKKVFVLKK